MIAALKAWLNVPLFAIDRRRRAALTGIWAVPMNIDDGDDTPPARFPGTGQHDQIGFFRVAGLVRTLLAIIAPALVLQALVLNLMIKDRVRDAVDALRVDVVTQKEWQLQKSVNEKLYSDLRERLAAAEARVRSLEEDDAVTKAARATAAAIDAASRKGPR